MADLRDSGSQPLPEVTAAPPLPLPPAKQQQAQVQAQQQAGAPAGPAGISIEAAAGSSSGGWGGQSAAAAGTGTAAAAAAAAAAGTAAQQQQLVTSSGLAGGLAYLQQSKPTLGSMGLPLSSALSSLRGRLGLPASSSLAGLAVQQQVASISEEHDEGLLQLGNRALAGAGSSSSAAAAAGPPNTLQLIAAARQFLATSSAGQLRLADLPVLMADYRRLARLGWNMLLRCAPAACLLPLPAAAACCLIALPPSEAGHCEAASAW